MHTPIAQTVSPCPTADTESSRRLRPLCVDLDGTIIATDVLWESVLLLIKQRPWALFALPLWMWRGRPFVKRRLAESIILEPRDLPYREPVLEHLRGERAQGRTIFLTTGTDYQPAEAIAEHLGLFDGVLASNGETNFTGHHKRARLVAEFGEQGYDYVGDSDADLTVWASAHRAVLVAPSRRVLKQAALTCAVEQIFREPSRPVRAVVRALRLSQWIKNVLVFLPLIASHHLLNWASVSQALWAFCTFCLCASSIYVLNDLLDLGADRRHPKKQYRPFACGALSIPFGLAMFPILLSGSAAIALTLLPENFLPVLGLYIAVTTGYSLVFKQVAILDVLVLAGLYTLRVVAGGLAIGVPISAWLLAFSLFFFLSLAFTKRHLELEFRKVQESQGLERRAYQGLDKTALANMGTISGYMSVLVLALYINSEDVLQLYARPEVLWFMCPLLLYWISRNWLLASRGTLDDDPLVRAVGDIHSYIVVAALSLVAILAI